MAMMIRNDSRIEGSRTYLFLLTLTATLGGLLFGYDTAVISGTVSSLREFFIEPYGWPETMANSRHGLVVSSALIGCIFGAVSGGLVSRYLGRKKGLLMAALLFLVSALGSAMPELFFRPVGEGDHTFLLNFVIYRIIGGIGVGLASMLSPLYIAEIAPSEIRGRLVSWNQFAIIFGMVVVYFVNYGIALQGEDAWLFSVGWRWMFASEIIPASLFALCLLTVPETPRFHVMKGADQRARRILERINGPARAAEILDEIRASFRREADAASPADPETGVRSSSASPADPEAGGRYSSASPANQPTGRRSTGLFSYGAGVIIIGLLLAMFQQFIGINVVLYYAPVIFRDMGAETDASLLSTVMVGIVNMIFTVLAIVTVDRFGRRPLMISGALIMGMAMIMLGITFYTGLEQGSIDGEAISGFSSRLAAVAAFALIMIYIAGFSMSWGPVTWVLLSEIFPNRIRGRALAVAVAMMWISNLIISWTFPILNNAALLVQKFNHGAAYWIYGIIALLAALFVARRVPETKRMSLEALESHWRKE